MSYYDDDRPRRSRSMRDRRDDYDDSSYRSSRGGGNRQTTMARRDDSDSADEEVNRDFPPGGGYYRETTLRKSGRGPVKSDRRYSDDRRDYGYADSKRSSKSNYDDKRSDRRSRRYSSGSSASRSPPRKERRKSMGEELLASLGLAGAAGALLGKKDKDRSDSRSPSRSRSRNRSRARSTRRGRSESDERDRGTKGRSKSVGREQMMQALKAAALAGAAEAFRAHREPGGWNGDKGKRVLTTAVAAAGIDGLISNKRDPDHHSKRDVIGSALAGLATNRLVNGPRSKSRGRNTSESPDRRGRSNSHGGGLGDLAAGGVLAAAGKKAYDSFRGRSKSRGQSRGRSRSSSFSSYDSRSPPRNKRRSQSVSGYAAKGLAALGLNSAADRVDPARMASRRDGQDSRRYDDNYYDNRGAPPPPGGNGQGYSDNRDVGSRSRSPGAVAAGGGAMVVGPPGHEYSLDYQPHHTGDPDTDSDSDLGSSSEDEKEHKKTRQKSLVTTGLATIATIHAAHSMYQAKEKRSANRKLLKEGDISKDEARKRKNKMRLQEAAALGIAGLGLKGAYSEWKEMKETKDEMKEHEEKMKRHAEKRENRRRKFEEERRFYAQHGYYATSMPNLETSKHNKSDDYHSPPPPMGPMAPHSATAGGAYYHDDNPYSSFSSPSPAYQPNGNGAFHGDGNGPFPPPPINRAPQTAGDGYVPPQESYHDGR